VVVVDANTGEPIADALVKASQFNFGMKAEARTDVKGVASFDVWCPWGMQESYFDRRIHLGTPTLWVEVEMESFFPYQEHLGIPVAWVVPGHSVVARPMRMKLVRDVADEPDGA
jgi:hypothetical protein